MYIEIFTELKIKKSHIPIQELHHLPTAHSCASLEFIPCSSSNSTKTSIFNEGHMLLQASFAPVYEVLI